MDKAVIYSDLQVQPTEFDLPNGANVRHEIVTHFGKQFHRYTWLNCPGWIYDIVPNRCISKSPLDLKTIHEWILDVKATAHAEKPRS